MSRVISWCALWFALAGSALAQGFTFGAFGDTPYSAEEESGFIAMLAEMNREPLAFVVHVGDFKDGHSVCSDAVFLQRKEWFDLSHHPLIYVPGDNEWIDCLRRSSGRYRPLERLDKLREIFFSGASSLGQRPLRLARQSDAGNAHRYPEHARWTHGGVVFATLNVPGGDNNFTRDREEFRARDAAVRDWVRQAFRLAQEKRLPGVVLMMQANPWAAAGARRHGYVPLIETITAETLAFAGEVVLIHGDTHRFRVDRPLLNPQTRRPLANFTRIEVFGSPSVNWVRVRVDDTGGRLRFEVRPGS
ncbi:MAG: metallophosphoesterase [Betaproteobacteria bacterium]|nr:metallophosphoesterase [Betaproteobacteria bacterium]